MVLRFEHWYCDLPRALDLSITPALMVRVIVQLVAIATGAFDACSAMLAPSLVVNFQFVVSFADLLEYPSDTSIHKQPYATPEVGEKQSPLRESAISVYVLLTALDVDETAKVASMRTVKKKSDRVVNNSSVFLIKWFCSVKQSRTCFAVVLPV